MAYDLKKTLHEFIAMILFVFFGCFPAMANSPADGLMAWRLYVAFGFGMSIMVLVYATAHTSGGQINSAVTLSLVVGGKLDWVQGLGNAVGQFLGAIIGALIVEAALPTQTGLGSNAVSPDYSSGQAFIGEFMGTLLLCIVVFQTAVDDKAITRSNEKANPLAAPIAIGFAVFLAHLALLPVTGCSINPPRSFGPALVATLAGEKGWFDDYWIFFIAPHMAGVVAALGNHLNNLGGEHDIDEKHEAEVMPKMGQVDSEALEMQEQV